MLASDCDSLVSALGAIKALLRLLRPIFKSILKALFKGKGLLEDLNTDEGPKAFPLKGL